MVTRLRLATSEFTQPLSDALKNVHGTRPRYANRTYGMPVWRFTFTPCVKTNVNTSVVDSGISTAQAIPSTACL